MINNDDLRKIDLMLTAPAGTHVAAYTVTLNHIKTELTPKRPYMIDDEVYGEMHICPECGYRVIMGLSNFCINCGKRIDWSDYD